MRWPARKQDAGTLPAGRVVATPILEVPDLVAATGFYRDVGFEVTAYDDGYAFVCVHGEEVMHLRLGPSATRHDDQRAYLHVADAAAWHVAMRERSAPVTALEDEPWGMREFALRDPFGNVVRIGQNL